MSLTPKLTFTPRSPVPTPTLPSHIINHQGKLWKVEILDKDGKLLDCDTSVWQRIEIEVARPALDAILESKGEDYKKIQKISLKDRICEIDNAKFEDSKVTDKMSRCFDKFQDIQKTKNSFVQASIPSSAPTTVEGVGLRNRTGTLCWLNSVMQVIFHEPKLQTAITEAKNTHDDLKFFQPFLDAHTSYENDSQKLKEELDKLDTKHLTQCFNLSSTREEDAGEAFQKLLGKVLENYPDGQIQIEDTNTHQQSPEPLIHITPSINSLEENIQSSLQTLNKKLLKSPEILTLQITRFRDDLTKDSSPVNIKDIIQLDGSEYELTKIIAHEGIALNSGHYVCYIKKIDQNTGFGKYSDSHYEFIDQVPTDQLQKEAYILFYRRRLKIH